MGSTSPEWKLPPQARQVQDALAEEIQVLKHKKGPEEPEHPQRQPKPPPPLPLHGPGAAIPHQGPRRQEETQSGVGPQIKDVIRRQQEVVLISAGKQIGPQDRQGEEE